MKSHKTFYQYSLLILFIFEIVTQYYTPEDGSLAKLVMNLYIYFSLFFLFPINFKDLLLDFNKSSIILILLLILYGLFSIIRDIPEGELFSLFGNPLYGPSFLVPLFIIWGTRSDALYWLHRISMWAVKMGILFTPIALILDINLSFVAFLPTFFLLLNFKYAPTKDQIWIVLSLFVGGYVFYITDIRSGIIRILLCLIVFLLTQLNFKKVYMYFAIFMIAFPIYGLYHGISSGKNVLSEILSFTSSEFGGSEDLTDDTRTFLYAELLSDLKETDKLFFGKGPMGTYYSEYFYNNEGDNYIRHDVEVGVLSYLLRGGIVYLLLIFIFIVFAIYNGIKFSNSRYIISLALMLSTFLLYSFIENIPDYSFYFSSVWIILGICISRKFLLLEDNQIENLIRYRGLTKPTVKKRIPFNTYP